MHQTTLIYTATNKSTRISKNKNNSNNLKSKQTITTTITTLNQTQLTNRKHLLDTTTPHQGQAMNLRDYSNKNTPLLLPIQSVPSQTLTLPPSSHQQQKSYNNPIKTQPNTPLNPQTHPSPTQKQQTQSISTLTIKTT